jgi:hypothetical protein
MWLDALVRWFLTCGISRIAMTTPYFDPVESLVTPADYNQQFSHFLLIFYPATQLLIQYNRYVVLHSQSFINPLLPKI